MLSELDGPKPPGLFARWLSALVGDDPPPPDTPVGARVWRRVWPWIPVVLILALPAAALTVYLQAGWRAVDLSRRSGASLAAGDLRMAVLQAESAHRLRGSDPEVLRARARALTAAGDPRAVDAWARLAGRGELTADEERARAEAAARLAGDEEFERAVQGLERAGRRAEAERWRGFRGRAHLDKVSAAGHLRAALELEPTPARRLDLARVLVESGDAGSLAQAAALVDQADETPEGAALLAFGIDFLPTAGAATRLDWARRGVAWKSPDNAALLPAAGALISAGEESPDAMSAALASAFDGAPGAARAAFARWLASHRLAAQAAAQVPEGDARVDRDVFFARADVLAASEDWESLQQLASGPSPAGEWQTLLQEARAQRGLGRGAAAGQTVRRAALLAAEQGQLAAVIGWAEAEGEADLADDILLELCGQAPSADQAVRVARWRYGQRGQPRLREEALRRASGVAPQSASVLDLQRRAALFEGPAVSPDETATAWQAEPGNAELRLTHALALLRAGRASEARAVVLPVEAMAPQLPATHRAIIAAVLSASGSQDQALLLARSIPPGQLTDAEFALVYSILPAAPASGN